MIYQDNVEVSDERDYIKAISAFEHLLSALEDCEPYFINKEHEALKTNIAETIDMLEFEEHEYFKKTVEFRNMFMKNQIA